MASALLMAALLLTLRDLRVTDTVSESLLFLTWYLGPFSHLGALDTLNPARTPVTLAMVAALIAAHVIRRLPRPSEVPA